MQATLTECMKEIDSLIYARWVIPVEPQGQVLENHAVAIHQGKIVDILPHHNATEIYRADRTYHRLDHALIPGFINAHSHSAMSLLRGIADDKPLMTWLEKHIWPAEQQCVDKSFVQAGALLAMAEMLKSGTTTVADMYFFPDVFAQQARNVGMRTCIGLIVLDFPTVWAQNADEYISKGLELYDQYRHDPLVSTMFAPHAPYTVSDQPLQKIRTLADELGVPIQMHVHETADEVNNGQQQSGQRPLQRLEQMNILGPDFMAVHMTQLSAQEIKKLADTGAHVVHCPASNMKLASGTCPVSDLLAQGVNVALGTDGAASNNNLDLLAEMRLAALLGKLTSQNAAALDAVSALSMATINGARALGIEGDTGSLETGKAADMTVIDLNRVNTQPVYDPIAQIVYAAKQEQVSDVWVNGKILLQDGSLTELNESQILDSAKSWQQELVKYYRS